MDYGVFFQYPFVSDTKLGKFLHNILYIHVFVQFILL